MNILFLTRLYFPHVGGVEKHLLEISKILSQKHHITIITEQHDPALLEYESRPEAEIYRIPLRGVSESGKKWHIWSWFSKNQHLLKNADIIHVHDVFFWLFPYKILHTFQKIFMTFHGYEGSQLPNSKQIFLHRLAEKLSVGNICIGDFHKKWYDTKPDFISYGGVSAKTSQHKKKANKSIFIGRLAEDTGILDYLRAVSGSNLTLDVFGDGPLLLQSKKLSHKLKLTVKYHNFVPDADKFLPQYSLAFVSRYLAILEALAAKVPVIAHYNNRIKFDYLNDAPFSKFIKICHNPQELSDAITEVNGNKQIREKMIEEGYNWAVDQTWKKLASEYEQLWRIGSQ